VFLRKVRVDNEYHPSELASTHQEILWFDIERYRRLGMDVFNPERLAGQQAAEMPSMRILGCKS